MGEFNRHDVDEEMMPNINLPIGLAKHKFEIPYNNDKNLINKIGNDLLYRSYTKFMYLPCNKDHGITVSQKDRKADYTKREIDEIISLIKENGLEPCILIQRGGNLNSIKYYYERGVRFFTLGDDDLAKSARRKYCDSIYLTSSITNIKTFEEYFDLDPNLYDINILFFWFNRHLDQIKMLPKNKKYGLIVNNHCIYNCIYSLQHWFQDYYKIEVSNFDCAKIRFNSDGLNLDKTTFILPSDLHYFDDCISSYKLGDRMFNTEIILNNLYNYITLNNFTNKFKSDTDRNYQIETEDYMDDIKVVLENSIKLSDFNEQS